MPVKTNEDKEQNNNIAYSKQYVHKWGQNNL